jgi:hypothetical protein
MTSKSMQKFKDNSADVAKLIEFHGLIAGKTRGRKHGVQVLNKSAIVLILAFWEAFIEDLAGEAVALLVLNVEGPVNLPTRLKAYIGTKVVQDKSPLRCWSLASQGWKKEVMDNYLDAFNARVGKVNVPKTNVVAGVIRRCVGL